MLIEECQVILKYKLFAKILSEEIKSLAEDWGWHDTEVGDRLFGYIKKLKAEEVIK